MVKPPRIRDDGFYRGRCEPVKLMYDFNSKGLKGKYIDVVSLYPTVMYYDRYLAGHPTRISKPDKYDNNFFGFIYCKILPPTCCIYPCYPTNRRSSKLQNYCSDYVNPACLAQVQNVPISIRCHKM